MIGCIKDFIAFDIVYRFHIGSLMCCSSPLHTLACSATIDSVLGVQDSQGEVFVCAGDQC
jgi:hypothetical protein